MQRKKLLLIGLSLAAVFSLIYGIVTPSKTGRRLPSRSEKNGGDTSPPPLKNLIFAERHAKKSSFAAWGRNPFRAEEIPTRTLTKLFLNGIAWDEKTPKAVINNRIVGTGDPIGGHKVKRIEKNRVILSDGINDLELRLGQRQ